MSAFDAVYEPAGIPEPNFSFERSTWVRWILELFDKGGQSREEWTYFAIPSSGYGAQSTNYGRKLFDYDSAGRQNETMCVGGTIDKTTFNAMGWPVKEELGTSAALVVTDKREYHPNGTPMKWTQLVDDETPDTDRVVEYTHDFRHRLTLVKSTGEQDGGDPWIHLRTLTYDNRDLRLVEEEYHTSVTGSHRIARRENAWDAMGRRYQRGVCKVNKSNGNFGTPLLSRWFYDAVGRVVREALAGSDLFTVIVFDAAGQETCRYQAFVPSGSSSSSSSSGAPGPDPTDISQSIVMEQDEQDFDKAGNRLSHTRRRRCDHATGLGTLKTPAASRRPA